MGRVRQQRHDAMAQRRGVARAQDDDYMALGRKTREMMQRTETRRTFNPQSQSTAKTWQLPQIWRFQLRTCSSKSRFDSRVAKRSSAAAAAPAAAPRGRRLFSIFWRSTTAVAVGSRRDPDVVSSTRAECADRPQHAHLPPPSPHTRDPSPTPAPSRAPTATPSSRRERRELAMPAAAPKKKVWVRDPALVQTDVFEGGTVVSDDGKQARELIEVPTAAQGGRVWHARAALPRVCSAALARAAALRCVHATMGGTS